LIGFERIANAVALRTPNRRKKEIPVAPLIISFAGRCAGVQQAQIFGDVKLWRKAQKMTYDRIGLCDAVFGLWPRDVAFSQLMRFKLPGKELAADAQFQILEEEIMVPEDYSFIAHYGYQEWIHRYISRVRFEPGSPRLRRFQHIAGYIGMGLRVRSNVKHWHSIGIPASFYAAIYPAFDMFSLARSFEPFTFDLFERPEEIQKACASATPALVKSAKQALQRLGAKTVCIYPMRSSESFISPAFFERFAFPYLVEAVEAFVRDGIICVLHCDGNWTGMLGYLKELPPACCIVELDGSTDIFKAKEVLSGRMCICGDVPASLLAQGSPLEVREYCDRLIGEIGREGGFILGSGCEVPLDAKVENVKAMVDSARSEVGSGLKSF